jgi:hypothetical protein
VGARHVQLRGRVRADARDVLPPQPPAPPGLDPGALLLEAARRADERALIATEVPGPESVFAPVAPARPDDADAEPLGDDERRVLPLLDARRDVRALADDAGLSEFHAARALHALVRRGRARRVTRPAGPAAARAHGARADEHRNLGVAFSRAGCSTRPRASSAACSSCARATRTPGSTSASSRSARAAGATRPPCSARPPRSRRRAARCSTR